MRILSLVGLLFIFSQTLMGQKINYRVSILEPQTRYAEVVIEISGQTQSETDFYMPVWTPGSYMVREFSRNVEQVLAYNNEGEELKVVKIAKNAWKVSNGKQQNFQLNYKVYANEVSVRTTFINNETAFLSGTSLLMYAEGFQNLKGTIDIRMPEYWKNIATGLETVYEGKYQFNDYDELVDCPLQLGNFDTLEFKVMNIPHFVALVGESNVNKNKLKKDLQKICEVTAAVINKADFSKYWFFVHHVDQGGGGLEHTNSTAVVMTRNDYNNKEKYEGFLRLCAHEYFHTWNVKRIRPIELGPFDYNNEVYTQQLWVAEGITTYYDKLLMYRAGFWNEEQLLGHLASAIGYSENTPGTKVQSLALSSFDTWIKFYRPDENSVNSAISYYTKGAMAAALLDISITKHTDGKKNLDDVLKFLYDEYYVKKQRGFTEVEFKNACKKIAGTSLNSFFETLIYSTQSPDYNEYYNTVGYEVIMENSSEVYVGINTQIVNGKMEVSNVLRYSPAFNAGLSKGDIIVSVNGIVPDGTLTNILKKSGTYEFVIMRGSRTFSTNLTSTDNPNVKVKIKKLDTPSKTQKNLQGAWPR